MSADGGDLAHRIEDIEEAYEFMLGYAAQGHQRGREGDHIRDFLKRLDAALDGIGAAATTAALAKGVDGAIMRAYAATLDDDARKARVELQLALMQRAIGSLHERSEEHTSELQSLTNLVCRLLLEKKKKKKKI